VRWPGAGDACAYRVSVRPEGGGTPFLEADVTDPELSIPGTELPAGQRCEWRVFVRRSPEGEWEPYLPEILLADEALAEQPELSWPEVPSALAYRVLVRDDHAGEVVLKHGFLSAPGRIDWSRLDPSHLYRVRVQAWVDGAWRDHLPYRTVFPPAAQMTGELLELEWFAAADAVDYRFSMRPESGEGFALDLEVTEPVVRVPASLLPSGTRCQWQVAVRRSPDGEWEPHLPEIVITDERLTSQPELSWPQVPGALAYRVVIRDEELDATVSKHGFLEPRGWIDWTRLELPNPHRVRVQAWVQAAWQDHLPYRVAFPPPERVLGPRASAPAGRLEHVVVVQFPGRHLDAAYGVQRPDALHASRLRLFESWTLPSLELLAGEGVAWFVIADGDLPEAIAEALRELCDSRLLHPGAGQAPEFGGRGEGTSIAWLTAGDALHPGVPAAVERRAEAFTGTEARGVEFPMCVEASPERARLARTPAPASFLVAVEPPDRLVSPVDPRHPILRLPSLDAQVSDWSVPALLRARPGPNEHPIFLRERGPGVAVELLTSFGVSPVDAVPPRRARPAGA
jgi:hypothetical protein